MSDTLASLRRKIAGAGDLESLVRSMKALAAANIGQYEQSVLALADYDRTVELGLVVCLRRRGVAVPRAGPAAMQRAQKNIAELVETLNQRYRRPRQESIDNELFEVLSGHEALDKEY